MGEVRVKIKIINSIDEGLARRGQISLAEVRSREVEGVVDTGAVSLVIPIQLAQNLGLQAVRQTNAKLADASSVTLDVSEPVGVEIEGRRTTVEAFLTGDTILIGQVVLETTDLLVDCSSQTVIPNPARPLQPTFRI